MELKEILDIVVIPVSLALLALIWPARQSAIRRHEFKRLILRELEELSPYPDKTKVLEGWWEHQNKNFVHQKIFQNVSDNRDFILSLDPDLVYFVSQLWDAKNNKNDTQWLQYLKESSNCKYDRWGKIAEALKEWEDLCDEYNKLKE
jgi:hypothetical protein